MIINTFIHLSLYIYVIFIMASICIFISSFRLKYIPKYSYMFTTGAPISLRAGVHSLCITFFQIYHIYSLVSLVAHLLPFSEEMAVLQTSFYLVPFHFDRSIPQLCQYNSLFDSASDIL